MCQSATNQTKELGWLSYLSNICPPPLAKKWGVKKNFCSPRSQNCSPHFQNRGAAPAPPKTFWKIFTSVKSFCVKFYRFVRNSYPHISTNFRTFILIFHQMALIIARVPLVFTVSSFEYWMQTLREQGLNEKAIISRYTPTKGESWALLRKSAVESTTLAQPFCVNQAVELQHLPQRLHAQFAVVRQFSHW